MKDILTGKAKEDFVEWLWLDKAAFESDVYLDEGQLPVSLLLALQIEWLDSLGYYIEIGVYPAGSNTIEFSFSIFGNCGIDSELMFITRKEATEAAIKEAVKVYNSR